MVIKRGLILDDVGVGKTAEFLGLVQVLKNMGLLKKALLVAPASLILSSWKRDGLDKFCPDIRYEIPTEDSKERKALYARDDYDLLIMSYERMVRDFTILKDLNFDLLGADEADVARNKGTKRYQRLKKLSLQCPRVTLMTGTPVNNSLLDFHSMLSILGLDCIFGDEDEFTYNFIDRVWDEIWVAGQKKKVPRVVGHKNIEQFSQLVAPFYLRRLKEEVGAKTPELTSKTVKLELTPKQREVYTDLQLQMAQQDYKDKNALFAAFLQLRQCCTSSSLVTGMSDESVKFDWLCKKLTTDWKEEKLVVYSTWKESLSLLAKRFEELGIGYSVYTADVPQKKREEGRQRFLSSPDCQVLLGTTAMERGLNLQISRLQINIDLLFNPMRHGQLSGRVARQGSEHDEAFVVFLIAKNTIEERIWEKLRTKQAVSALVFGEHKTIFGNFSKHELLDIIKAKE